MIAGSPLSLMLGYGVPFFALGVGMLLVFMLRSVPAGRWHHPGHWLKALLLGTFVTVVFITPISMVLGLFTTAIVLP